MNHVLDHPQSHHPLVCELANEGNPPSSPYAPHRCIIHPPEPMCIMARNKVLLSQALEIAQRHTAKRPCPLRGTVVILGHTNPRTEAVYPDAYLVTTGATTRHGTKPRPKHKSLKLSASERTNPSRTRNSAIVIEAPRRSHHDPAHENVFSLIRSVRPVTSHLGHPYPYYAWFSPEPTAKPLTGISFREIKSHCLKRLLGFSLKHESRPLIGRRVTRFVLAESHKA